MSSDKNILKTLLNKLLESRLKKLEKSSQEQIKDLNLTKIQYKKQGELINKLKIKKKQNPRQKTFDNSKFYFKFNYNYKSPNRKNNVPSFIKSNSPSNQNKKFLLRNAKTPISKQNYPILFSTRTDYTNLYMNKGNNKYNYVKSRYKEETKNKNNNKIDNKKLHLTPEPKIRKKRLNIKPKKLNYKDNKNNKENNDKKDNKGNIRNINTIKREEDYKKRTIVSDIDLGEEEINFVLGELKKDEDREKEKKNKEKVSNNNDSDNENESKSSSFYNKDNGSNSDRSDSNRSSESSTKKIKQKYTIKNKEIINKFGKFLISSDGNGIIKLICSFLDKKSKIKFLSISKKLIRPLTYYIEDLYKEAININNITFSNTIESQINNIKKKCKDEDYDSPKHAFSLSKGSLKALELLNSEAYNKIFKKEKLEPPLDSIILIYRILFQLIYKEELIGITNDKKFWEKTRKYILENNEGKTGNFIKEYISEFDFTNKNIYKLKKLVNGNEDKIKPLVYENICRTTGVITFIVKDSLEYCGIIYNDRKTKPNIVINYLEELQKNLNRAKDYIDTLKEMGNY